MADIKLEHAEENSKGRFTIYYDNDEAGYILYEWLPNGNLLANGTLVYNDFRDKKLGKPLYDALMNFARSKNTHIYPTCPFVVKSMLRDKSVHDLLDDKFKAENNL